MSKFNIGDVIVCKSLEKRPLNADTDLFKVIEISPNSVIAKNLFDSIKIPIKNIDKYEEVFNLRWQWEYTLDNQKDRTRKRYNYEELDRDICFESAMPIYEKGFYL